MNNENKLSTKVKYGLIIATFVAAAFLIAVAVIGYINGQAQKQATEKQTQQIETLVREIKSLSEENKKLNQTSNNYAYCNAVLLAKYTQTQQPITIDDLNECVLSSFPAGTNAPTNSGVTNGANNSSTPSTTAPRSSTNNTTNNSTTNNSVLPPVVVPPAQQPSTPSGSAPVLTVPNLLQLNAPCLNVLGAAKTC